MRDYEDIRFELNEGIAVITLHRPEQMNSFSGKMGEELGDAYRRCDQDDDIRVAILTGAGVAFCAGADMTAGAETFASQEISNFSASPVSPKAWEVRKPIIAALNGHAVGLGLTLALQCDMRICANEGKYGVLQVRRGVMPDAHCHWTLPRLVGTERAASLLLTGRKIQGPEAEAMGLVLKSVPAVDVLETAMEIARDIATNTAPLSVAITKKLLWESTGLSAAEVERAETDLHHHLMGASDAIEGPVAYLERRKPQWKLTVSKDWPKWPGEDED
ncbi:MAG: enoyl-CoA hydratase-related protein [Myxococcales bacterium]